MIRWLLLLLGIAFSASLLLPWELLLGIDRGVALAVLVEWVCGCRAPCWLWLTGRPSARRGRRIQALFANPLASPDLTGTTSGAALGAVVTAYLFSFAAPIALSIGSVLGALGALALLLALAGPRAEISETGNREYFLSIPRFRSTIPHEKTWQRSVAWICVLGRHPDGDNFFFRAALYSTANEISTCRKCGWPRDFPWLLRPLPRRRRERTRPSGPRAQLQSGRSNPAYQARQRRVSPRPSPKHPRRHSDARRPRLPRNAGVGSGLSSD